MLDIFLEEGKQPIELSIENLANKFGVVDFDDKYLVETVHCMISLLNPDENITGKPKIGCRRFIEKKVIPKMDFYQDIDMHRRRNPNYGSMKTVYNKPTNTLKRKLVKKGEDHRTDGDFFYSEYYGHECVALYTK
ncbi:unnamed protein product, partial [marine sediment metagenome]